MMHDLPNCYRLVILLNMTNARKTQDIPGRIYSFDVDAMRRLAAAKSTRADPTLPK
jgi:hypothetical protein